MPNNLRAASPLPWALTLAGLFLLLALWPGAEPALRYQREAILEGQVWRVFTGHFVHLNLNHALLNGAGTLMLAAFLPRELPVRYWWPVLLLAPFVISLGLWLRQPALLSYVGFSGVLHGLLYLGVIRLLPVAPVLAGIVLAVLVGRQLWEQTAAYDPNYMRSLIGGRVMPDAHLFGGLTGAVLGLCSLWRDRLPKKKTSGYSPGADPGSDD